MRHCQCWFLGLQTIPRLKSFAPLVLLSFRLWLIQNQLSWAANVLMTDHWSSWATAIKLVSDLDFHILLCVLGYNLITTWANLTFNGLTCHFFFMMDFWESINKFLPYHIFIFNCWRVIAQPYINYFICPHREPLWINFAVHSMILVSAIQKNKAGNEECAKLESSDFQ